MHIQYIKYLEGSFARAAHCRADFLFILRLKAAYNQGFLKDSLKEIGERIGETRNTVKMRLNSLEKRNWITRLDKGNQIGYKLISYTDLYLDLGYELKPSGMGFKNCYSFYKIQATDETLKNKTKLKTLMCGYDHVRRSNRMTIQHYKAKQETCKYSSVFLNLSCMGSASVMGYRSSRKGFEILKELEGMGIIEVQRSSRLIKKCHILTYKKQRCWLPDTAHFKNTKDGWGEVYAKNCNKFKTANLSPLLYNLQTSPRSLSLQSKALLGF